MEHSITHVFSGRARDVDAPRIRAECGPLTFCAERGEEPEKPYSGQFVVRAEPGLHRALSTAARKEGLSLNKWVTRTLEKALG